MQPSTGDVGATSANHTGQPPAPCTRPRKGQCIPIAASPNYNRQHTAETGVGASESWDGRRLSTHSSKAEAREGAFRVSNMDSGPGQHHNPPVNPEHTLVTSVTKVTLHTPVSQSVRICTIVWNTDKRGWSRGFRKKACWPINEAQGSPRPHQ